jgi:replicative DNA helicase
VRPPEGKSRHPALYYGSSSEGLTRDVQSLLLRVGINAVVRRVDMGEKGRPQYTARVMGRDEILRFADVIGAVGAYKSGALQVSRAYAAEREANTNRDVIPREVWRNIAVPVMGRRGITMRQLQANLGMSFMGTGLYKQNISRERAGRLARAVGGDDTLEALASSDVYWDETVSITPGGEEEVFDLTVPGPSNFLANDIVVHNSIEQDADTVLMLHRPEPEPGQRGETIDIIIAKNRSGPTDTITLTFVKQFMRFENFAVESPFSYGGATAAEPLHYPRAPRAGAARFDHDARRHRPRHSPARRRAAPDPRGRAHRPPARTRRPQRRRRRPARRHRRLAGGRRAG